MNQTANTKNIGSLANQAILVIKNLSKSFTTPSGEISILKDFNLEVNAGERVAIVGESGCGKSTLLQIAGLLDKATSGKVFINSKDTSQLKDKEKSQLRNHQIGFVYQSHHLLREFTALENVMMPALISGASQSSEPKQSGDASEEKIRQRAETLLKKVGLEKRMEHFPYALSGGEQQRVAIARALMNNPKILLADEPTGNLDPTTAEEVSEMLNQIVKSENMAMLIVTHSDHLAKQCDRIEVL